MLNNIDKNAKVVAFEPFPGNHQFFHRNTQIYPHDVHLVAKAVCDEVGEAYFEVPQEVDMNKEGYHLHRIFDRIILVFYVEFP